jgi:hypothetical protein
MLEVETWIENEMRRLDPDAYPAPTALPVSAVEQPSTSA